VGFAEGFRLMGLLAFVMEFKCFGLNFLLSGKSNQHLRNQILLVEEKEQFFLFEVKTHQEKKNQPCFLSSIFDEPLIQGQ
jgi:hypothetical protein